MSQSNSTDNHNNNNNNPINQTSINHEEFIHSRLNSIIPECNHVKIDYDLCFEEFFPKFLNGSTFHYDPCEKKLKIYQKCLRNALKNSLNIDLNELDSMRTDAETIQKITNQNIK
ncbi:unnamed protein product [Schistosoma spindalis]|nr:unnamed protein product [Schistosoma spindale]